MSKAESEAARKRLLAEMEDFPARIRDLRVVPRATPDEVRGEIESRFPLDRPVPLDRLTDEVAAILRQWTLHVTHPRYFGLFNPSVREAAVLGDALAALYNPQLAVWSHAPGAQELERLVLRRFAGLLGLDPDRAAANFTSGGAEANLSAVLAALAHAHPECGERGVSAIAGRPLVYLSGESHHSFVKIARMTGIGTEALREVESDAGLAMDPRALDRRLRADREKGDAPLLVVATAGTTSAGTVDPIAELADVAAAAGIWLHVDAAWGGAACLSQRLRPVLSGIDRADSVTWDAHKWLSVPMGAGMFFCRHPEAVERAFTASTSYMPGASGDGTSDPYLNTAQWSRRAIGLKTFMAVAELGLPGLAKLIERQTEMGDRLRARLRAAGFVPVNDTPLPVVCFTHPAIREGRCTTADVLARIYERGRVWISDVVLGGRERALRACITSFRTDESDLDVLLAELEDALASAAGSD